MRDVRISFTIVWLILSGAVALILVAPCLLAPQTIARWKPACEWKAKYNRECVLCGMTTSFIAISRGDLRKALAANGASLFVYSGFVCNEICLLAWFRKRAKAVRRSRSSRFKRATDCIKDEEAVCRS